MKSSLMMISGAAVVMAGPLRRDVDIVYEVVTNVVTDIVYNTVYETATAAPVVAEPVETPVAPAVVAEPVETPVAPAVVFVTVTAGPTTSTVPAAAATPNVNVAVAADPTTVAAAASTPTGFNNIALHHHNVHRANQSAPDVTYSETLAGFAATLSGRCVFEHDVTIGVGAEYPSYGQNIAMYAATDIENLTQEEFLAQSISDFWFNNEIELYPGPYGAEPDMTNFEAWGHYSQVVWKGSTEIGCAIAYCEPDTMEPGMGAYMSTCNYYPAGNVDTEYAANVLEPLGGTVVSA